MAHQTLFLVHLIITMHDWSRAYTNQRLLNQENQEIFLRCVITRISWFPKSKKSMSKSTIIECAFDGEIHKIHEIQINRTHPPCILHFAGGFPHSIRSTFPSQCWARFHCTGHIVYLLLIRVFIHVVLAVFVVASLCFSEFDCH